MSDFGDPSVPRPPPPPPPGAGPFPPQQAPPPPPAAAAVPPAPGAYGATAPPPYGATAPPPVYGAPGTPSPYGPRSAFGQQQYAAMRTGRPAVPVGAVLLLVGGVVVALGSILNWFTVVDTDVTGFTKTGNDGSRDGPFFLTIGLVLVAFAIALLSAKKVLALTIIGIAIAALTTLVALTDLGDVQDVNDTARAAGLPFSTGPGLYLCVVGGLVALAGAIAATAKRRR